MKVCTKCKTCKDKTEFYSGKSICKVCKKLYQKEYADNNKEKVAEQRKESHKKNRESRLIKQKEYRDNNKESAALTKKIWYENNKELVSPKRKAYRENNKDSIAARSKAYYEKNKTQIIKRQNKQVAEKCKRDPLFAMQLRIRTSIRQSIRNNGYTKNSNTEAILGCSFEFFMAHIESQFVDGMSWENSSKWHIDHIYPVSKAENEEHLIRLNHYTNLQPLWAADNLKKGNTIPDDCLV